MRIKKLKVIFKNKKLTKKEKLYIAKKVDEINDFDLKNWKAHIKNEATSDGIQSALTSGL